MLIWIAFSIFALAAVAMLGGGIVLTVKQFAFLARAYRVQGTVISEWRYRHYGIVAQRYYRVQFELRNGQRAELRGSGMQPSVGEQQAVLVLERSGRGPKAQIDAWSELWSVPAMMLSLGAAFALQVALMFSGINV